MFFINLEHKARLLLHQLGVHSDYKGYDYFLYGICLLQHGSYPAMELYRDIAIAHGTVAANVERSLRTIICRAQVNAPTLISELMGPDVHRRPMVSRFLCAAENWLSLHHVVELPAAQCGFHNLTWSVSGESHK